MRGSSIGRRYRRLRANGLLTQKEATFLYTCMLLRAMNGYLLARVLDYWNTAADIPYLCDIVSGTVLVT